MNKLELESVIFDIKSIISQDPSTIRRIGVFGSLARHETHEKSDIDIAIEYETENYSFDNFVKFLEVCEQMEDTLSGKYGRKIDVIHVEEREDCLLQDIREEVIWI